MRKMADGGTIIAGFKLGVGGEEMDSPKIPLRVESKSWPLLSSGLTVILIRTGDRRNF